METDETQLSAEEKRRAQFKKQSAKRFSISSLDSLRETDEAESSPQKNVENEVAQEEIVQEDSSEPIESIKIKSSALQPKVKSTKKSSKSKDEPDAGFIVVPIRVPAHEYEQLFDLAIQESSETRKRCSPTKLIQSAYRSKYIKGVKK